MDIKNAKFLLKPGFFIMVSVICFLTSFETLAVLALSALVHEAGHLLAIALCGGKVRGLELGFCAFTINYDGRGMSYFLEAAAALSGPAASFFAALAAAAIWRRTGLEIMTDLAGMNIVLGLFNLIPIRFLDGGRAVGALAARFFGEAAAERVGTVLEATALTALLVFGVYVYSRTGDNPSLLIISASLIIFGCKNRKNSVQSTGS